MPSMVSEMPVETVSVGTGQMVPERPDREESLHTTPDEKSAVLGMTARDVQRPIMTWAMFTVLLGETRSEIWDTI